MTEKYSILQKKLQKLESLVNKTLLSDVPHDSSSHQTSSQEIKSRFVFLRSFLSAEISNYSSDPNKMPHYLSYIAQRLTDLENTFNEWDHTKCTDHINKLTALSGFEPLETFSTCSCTESCFKEDGDGDRFGDVAVALDFDNVGNCDDDDDLRGEVSVVEKVLDGCVEEKAAEVKEKTVIRAKEREKKKDLVMKKGGKLKQKEKLERRRFWCGDCFRGFLFGVALMGYVMVGFTGCFQVEEHNLRFTPT